MLSYILPVEEEPPPVTPNSHWQLSFSGDEPVANGKISTPISKETSISSFASDLTSATASHSSITPTGTSDKGKPKLIINGKHPTLKRVSFGSSKGSMVETLIFESPVHEEQEPSPTPEICSPFSVDEDPPDTDSGWENPFRPGGDLSREADEIVELIKGGKPITPTPGEQAPHILTSDSTDNTPLVNNVQEPITESPKKTAPLQAASTPRNANGTAPKSNNNAAPGTVEVKRVTVKPEGDASQVEHVTIKKKQKCGCCVIQ